MLQHFMFNDNLSLDNALTSTQIIHQLITRMNKIIDEVNNIDSKANVYTDKEVEKVKETLTNLINTVNTDLSKSLDDLDAKLTTEIEINANDISKINDNLKNIDKDIDRLEKDIANANRLSLTYYNTLLNIINSLKLYVDKLIELMTVKIYSPLSGTQKNIQEVVNDIFNVFSLNIGNVTLKYVKKLYNDLPQLTIDDEHIYLKNMTFLTVKNFLNYMKSKDHEYIKLYYVGDVNLSSMFTIYVKLKSAKQYSLYEFILLMSYYIKDTVGSDSTISDISNAILKYSYATTGYAYASFLPVSFSWYDPD